MRQKVGQYSSSAHNQGCTHCRRTRQVLTAQSQRCTHCPGTRSVFTVQSQRHTCCPELGVPTAPEQEVYPLPGTRGALSELCFKLTSFLFVVVGFFGVQFSFSLQLHLSDDWTAFSVSQQRRCTYFFFFFFFFFWSFQGRTSSIWRLPGQGSNWTCSHWPQPQPKQCWIQAPSVTYNIAHSMPDS